MEKYENKNYEVRIKNKKGLLIYTAFIQNHHLKITAINEAINELAWQNVPVLIDGDLTIECNEV